MQTTLKGVMVGDFLLCLGSIFMIKRVLLPSKLPKMSSLSARARATVSALQRHKRSIAYRRFLQVADQKLCEARSSMDDQGRNILASIFHTHSRCVKLALRASLHHRGGVSRLVLEWLECLRGPASHSRL